MTSEPPPSLPALAREALAVQDACNLQAVVHGFARALQQLRYFYPSNSVYHFHPIAKVWADKIASLTGTQHDWDVAGAYTAVRQIAGLESSPCSSKSA